MPSSAGVCHSFKSEAMLGYHQLGAVTLTSRTSLTVPTTDTLKAALYLSAGTTGPTATAYTVTNEATGTGYTAGGINVTNATSPATSGTVGFWTPSASLVYTTVSIGPVDGLLIYNSTQGNRAIEVCTFTAQTPVAATLTLTMPTNDGTTGLLRIT